MKIDRELIRTGVPMIDRQHEDYLELVNELFVLCMEPHVDMAVVNTHLSGLLAFAIEHFDAEEFLMLGTKYPHYEKHRAKHDEFRNQVDSLSSICEEMASSEQIHSELTTWLVEWFCDQTETHDQRLARYLRKTICDCTDV